MFYRLSKIAGLRNNDLNTRISHLSSVCALTDTPVPLPVGLKSSLVPAGLIFKELHLVSELSPFCLHNFTDISNT